MTQLPTEVHDVVLPVPLLRQQYWCSCGLASVCMAIQYHGLPLRERQMAKNPLVSKKLLGEYGFSPGRLGRIARSYGFNVCLIDNEPKDVGRRFMQEGGVHIRRDPTWRDMLVFLKEGVPVVCCIPDKREAFEDCRHRGSHWVTAYGYRHGDFLLHDPAPWRKATQCKTGYWKTWGCSLIAIRKPDFWKPTLFSKPMGKS